MLGTWTCVSQMTRYGWSCDVVTGKHSRMSFGIPCKPTMNCNENLIADLILGLFLNTTEIQWIQRMRENAWIGLIVKIISIYVTSWLSGNTWLTIQEVKKSNPFATEFFCQWTLGKTTVPSFPLASYQLLLEKIVFYSFVRISVQVVYLWSRWMECKMFFKLSSEYEGCTALVADVLVGFVRVRLLHVGAQRADLWVRTLTVRAAQHALVPISTLCVWNYTKKSEYY